VAQAGPSVTHAGPKVAQARPSFTRHGARGSHGNPQLSQDDSYSFG